MTTGAVLGGVGIFSSLLGGATQAAGAEQQAQAQYQMNMYQAGVAQINQQIALQNADFARDQGEREATQYGLAAGQRMGQIRASLASSGLDINSGSAKAVQDSQKVVTAMDLDTIRSNAAKTAYDYDVQSTQFENQSNLYKLAGSNALAAGQINVASSIIGSATSVSTKWLQGSQLGMWGGSGSSSSGSLIGDGGWNI